MIWELIPLLGIYPKNKSTDSKRYLHPMFIVALLKQPKYGNNLSVHQWMKKMCYSAIKKMKSCCL